MKQMLGLCAGRGVGVWVNRSSSYCAFDTVAIVFRSRAIHGRLALQPHQALSVPSYELQGWVSPNCSRWWWHQSSSPMCGVVVARGGGRGDAPSDGVSSVVAGILYRCGAWGAW